MATLLEDRAAPAAATVSAAAAAETVATAVDAALVAELARVTAQQLQPPQQPRDVHFDVLSATRNAPFTIRVHVSALLLDQGSIRLYRYRSANQRGAQLLGICENIAADLARELLDPSDIITRTVNFKGTRIESGIPVHRGRAVLSPGDYLLVYLTPTYKKKFRLSIPNLCRVSFANASC